MTRRPDYRSAEAQAYRKLYYTNRWRDLRAAQLAREPLCAMCLSQGRTTAATVADHKRPHRGDPTLFFDPDNLQSLCDAPASPWRCHSAAKQREDRAGFSPEVDADGWPTDPRHRANRP